MGAYRRYEILLPRRFNDGSPVPRRVFGEVLEALRERFGAVSSETQTIHGQWEDGRRVYRDHLIRFFVDVPRSEDSRAFFVEFKEELKIRFDQIEIWITSFDIETI